MGKFFLNICLLFGHLIVSLPVMAQIIPDDKLPINSNAVPNGNISTITGGTRVGPNLFHSFKEFSLSTGNTAYFNNTLDVQNIITRVTGTSISNIDGSIRANGTSNLFLLNPNGIVFGPNARLNISGSFLGTTASSINFSDGTQFSAKVSQNSPLLTISVPIGLGFGGNPGKIQVQGLGHSLVSSIQSAPVAGNSSSIGLQVQPGKTLALIGGEVILRGGILMAPGGRIELGSVDNGLVKLNTTSSDLTLSYENVPSFKDIHLSQRALVDASGTGFGAVQLSGKKIVLSDNSAVLIKNQGFSLSGNINVNASESLEMGSTGSDPNFAGGLRTEAMRLGDGGNIEVSTKRLVIQSGQSISTKTFSVGKGGNITVNATDVVQLTGVSPNNPLLNSNITAPTFGSGQAGNVTISTRRLALEAGGGIGSPSFRTGKGGNVTVNAVDSVEVVGVTPAFQPSALAASAFSSGYAGNVTVNTSKLLVGDGGRISSSTFARGNAGKVTINASDFVDIRGRVLGSVDPSLVVSAAYKLDSSAQKILGVPTQSSGASGDVIINTGRLIVTDGGQVSARNDGPSDAGTLKVNAHSIFLNNEGGITASTASGEGGNIFLNTQNLQLRHNSPITAAAQGNGNGGNININTGTLAVLENSNISANATQHQGGNIRINAQGIFRSPGSSITASGGTPEQNGTIRVNTLVNNSNLGLVRLPIVPVDAAKLIAQGCGVNTGPRGNKFVVTGSGGLPPDPTDLQTGDTGVQADWVETTAPVGENRASSSSPKKSHHSDPDDDDDFVEATGMIRNAKGQIEFVAQAPTYTPSVPWIKSPSCHAR